MWRGGAAGGGNGCGGHGTAAFPAMKEESPDPLADAAIQRSSFSCWSSLTASCTLLRRVLMRSSLRLWFFRAVILGAYSKRVCRRAESHHFVRLVLPALRCWRLTHAGSATRGQLRRAHRRTVETRHALRILSLRCEAQDRLVARLAATNIYCARCALRRLGRGAAAQRSGSWVALRGVLAQRLFATRRLLRRWAVRHTLWQSSVGQVRQAEAET